VFEAYSIHYPKEENVCRRKLFSNGTQLIAVDVIVKNYGCIYVDSPWKLKGVKGGCHD
jgi:hypothetical protein